MINEEDAKGGRLGVEKEEVEKEEGGKEEGGGRGGGRREAEG